MEACHSGLHGCMLLEIASGSLSTCIASCILALLVLNVPEQGAERIAIVNIKKDKVYRLNNICPETVKFVDFIINILQIPLRKISD